MDDKSIGYVHGALTATGFCIVDAATAFRLSPHIWVSAINCGSDFNSQDRQALKTIAERRAATIYSARAEGRDKPLLLLAVDVDDLARRVKWITGLRITELRVWREEVAPASAPAQAGAKVDEPPNYRCRARTQWFEARPGLKDSLATERWPAKRAETDVPRGL